MLFNSESREKEMDMSFVGNRWAQRYEDSSPNRERRPANFLSGGEKRFVGDSRSWLSYPSMKKILLTSLLLCISFGYFLYWNFSKIGELPPEEIISSTQQKPLLFTGDIMLGRFVETLSYRYGDDLFAFASTSDYLHSRVVISNLEGPIPKNHEPTPVNGFSFSFPTSTPSVLKRGGISAVSLANNHMFDKGTAGYEETKRALAVEGVAHFGGYSPTTDDYFETTIGTTTVIVYGITMIATGWDETQTLAVTKKLRAEHPDALLIAFLHWGDEYETQNRYQRAFAHTLIDLGVNAIVGSHPHVVQGVELYKGSPIFYSLGNFIFDQYWRDKVEDGYMLELTDTQDSFIYTVIPIHSVRSVPSVAATSTRSRILTDISSQSDSALRESLERGFIVVPKTQK